MKKSLSAVAGRMQCLAVVLLCLACLPSAAEDVGKWVGLDGPLGAQEAMDADKLRTADAAVQLADAQVDMAERALAVARRPVWNHFNSRLLVVPRMTRSDSDRIAFYKKNGVVARQVLLAALQQKRRADGGGESEGKDGKGFLFAESTVGRK